MKINKRLRVVILTILISILMTIISPLGQCVCYAEDGFSVSFSGPAWEKITVGLKDYYTFKYKNSSVEATGSNKVGSVSIYISNGYMIGDLPTVEGATMVTDSLYDVTYTDTGTTGSRLKFQDKYLYQTVIYTFNSLDDGNTYKVEDLIKQLKFLMKESDTNIKVTIDIDGSETKLPSGSHVTRGSGKYANHYYMYVPYASNAQLDDKKWSKAYVSAMNSTFMGMQGYLVTISDLEEDKILDNITLAGAWAGAAMVSKDLKLDDNPSSSDYWKDKISEDTITWLLESIDTSVYNKYSWMWVCGPEAGKYIGITDGYAETEAKKIYNVAKDTGGEYYSNWNRKKTGEGERPYEGDEPNCYNNSEFFMQVHYLSSDNNDVSQTQSEYGDEGALGWNDLNMTAWAGNDGQISGYFVEFSGTPTGVQSSTSMEQPHEWEYTVNGNKLNITCKATHEYVPVPCVYNENKAGELYKEVSIVLSAPSAEYDANAYDGNAVDGTQNVKMYIGKDSSGNPVEVTEEDFKQFLVSDVSKIKYIGTDGTEYEESETPPTDAGSYIAKVIATCNGDEKVIQQAFNITKKDVTFTLNDQSAIWQDEVTDVINKDFNVAGTNTATDKYLIKAISGFIGSDKDYYDLSVKEEAIDFDTSVVTTTGKVDLKNTVTDYIKYTVKSDAPAGTNVFSKNYQIEVVPGTLSVSKKTPEKSTDPSASDITYGYKVGDSEIVQGKYVDPRTREEIPRRFEWMDSEKDVIPNAGTATHNVKFIPEDTTHYSEIENIPVSVKVNPKDIKSGIENPGDTGITSQISIDIDNNPIVKLFDKQTERSLTGKDDSTGDYKVEKIVNGDKVTIKITGTMNYTGTYESLEFDLNKWDAFIETKCFLDQTTKELETLSNNQAFATDVPQDAGKKVMKNRGCAYYTEQESDSDHITVKDIVCEIDNDGASTKGGYKALFSIYLSNADYVAASDEPNENEKAAKNLAKTVISSGKIPSNAKIGMYFDASMDLQYRIYAGDDSSGNTKLEKNASNPESVTDISSSAFQSPVVGFSGFKETITITVPDRKGIDNVDLRKPSDGYTRKYYIIRVHGTPGSLSATPLEVTQNGNELSFETDKFSKYALAFVDTPIDPKKPDPQKSDDTGNTSSSSSSSSSSSNSTFTAANVKQAAPTTVQIVAPKTADTADMPAAVILVIAGIVLIFYVITMDSDERENDEQSTQIKVRLSEKLNREILKVKLKLLVESIENYIKDIKNKKNPGAR